MSSMDDAFANLMIQRSDMEVAEPTLEEDGGNQAASVFVGTCGSFCTSITHFSCCIGG